MTDQVFINGSSATTSPSLTTPPVVIDGSQIADSTANGLVFQPGTIGTNPTSPDNSTVRDLVVQNFGGAGLEINGANSISVFHTFLGTSADGTTAASNGTGLLILNGASNTIGGASTGLGNVISGNVGDGILIQGASATENVIQNNVIGLNIDSTSAVSNRGNGIRIAGTGTAGTAAGKTTIGGSLSSARNTISGNVDAGVLITDGSQSNLVQFNLIGSDGTGTSSIANAVGVSLTGGTTGNTIGGSNTTSSGTSLSGGNLISGNAQVGVKLDNAQKNLVIGNYIGTNLSGSAALTGTPTADGVLLTNNASNNTIGTALASQTNVISGLSEAGVMIQGGTISGSMSASNIIQGNYIGTNSAGTTAIPNALGVEVAGGATSNSIGGTTSGTRNVISGNTGAGVFLTSASTKTAVQSNLIGLQVNGTSAVANGDSGVKIDGSSTNAIGGTVSGAANVIANNQGDGVVVLSGINNAIRHNSIFANTGIGIDLGGDGVTPNHNPPLQTGPNLTLNYPVLDPAMAGSGSTQISGSYVGVANTMYTIELYSIDTPDPSGHGQGRTYLGSTVAGTDASGNATFSTNVSSAVSSSAKVTALAIDPNGNTSEFAANAAVTNPKADVAVTMTASAPASNQAGVVATGGFLVYTITVTNHGPDQATGVSLVDTLPTGVTVIGTDAPYNTVTQASSTLTINVGTLDNGQTMTYHVTTTAPSNVPTTNPIANKVVARVGGTVTDPDTTNNTAIATTTVNAGVNLAVTSSFMPSQPVQGQETVIYFFITNQTGTQATNVVLTDSLPSNFQVDQITTTQGTVNATQNGVFTVDLGSLPPSSLGTPPPSGATARVAIYGKPTASYQFLTNVASASAGRGRNAGEQQHVGGDGRGGALGGGAGVGFDRHHGAHGSKVARTGIHRQPTQYHLTYSEAMDPTSTQNLANYRIVTAGADRKFGTADDRSLR